AGTAAAQSCPVKIGGVLPLTGSMAPITKKIAQAAELAIEHVNQGGGVKGCPVQFILRDDQGQPTVGVDAAKYLVEVERVPAFTGTISSGVTGPIISAVTAPSKVVQITCCSTASPFTLDGRSGGYFFRTIPTSKTQAYATASETVRRGMTKTVVIYINTDFGPDMLRFYKAAVANVDAFNRSFEEKCKADTKGPGVHTQYDALMVMALAMNIAPDLSGPAIKDAVRRVHVPSGAPVGTGPAEFKKALELIKAGKPIKYFGATGPIEFDANGDVTGPALVWKIKDGQIVTDRIITIEDMQVLFKRIEN